MNSPQQDIALIRKYHNGELSPAEKNQLEVRALDDPFLQDALDGYERSGVKDDDILALYQKLEERIAPSKFITPIWGFKQWGIAASVIFCIALGSIYFNQIPKDKSIALNDIQQKEDIPQAEKSKITPPDNKNADVLDIDKSDLSAEAKIEPTQLGESKSFSPEQDIVVEPLAAFTEKKDTSTDLGEGVVMGYGTQKKESLTGALSSINPESLMASRMMMRAEKASPTFKLQGKVLDEKDSSPLPGVSIKNLESGVIKQTDVNGDFNIDANKNDDLVISYLGYQAKKTVVQQDSLLISLKPDLAALNEVVVVGYGTQIRSTNNAVGPKVGWRAFKNYLEEQTKNINIGRGRVQLQFIINPNGDLTNFKIIETFSAKAGVAAIDIIKNYNGGWSGSLDKVPHKASITIKFK